MRRQKEEEVIDISLRLKPYPSLADEALTPQRALEFRTDAQAEALFARSRSRSLRASSPYDPHCMSNHEAVASITRLLCRCSKRPDLIELATQHTQRRSQTLTTTVYTLRLAIKATRVHASVMMVST